MTDRDRVAKFETLRESGLLSELDIHFARLVARLEGNPENVWPLFLAAALTSHVTASLKHVCLRLDGLSGGTLLDHPDVLLGDESPDAHPARGVLKESPVPETLSDLARNFPRTVGADASGCSPLVLHDNRLYLRRYWEYEQELAAWIASRAGAPEITLPLKAGELTAISALFAKNPRSFPNDPDYQQIAVLAAARNAFTVITGGPGTGKTTVVNAVLAVRLAADPSTRIALCAPTGKAQSRLREAVLRGLTDLTCSEVVRQAIADVPCSTIHRLLGPLPDSPDFRHDRENPLPFDLVITDEASMVPLSLMTRLTRALPKRAGLVLLGDKDQLASVESGAVLAEVCSAFGVNVFTERFASSYRLVAADHAPLPSPPVEGWTADHVVELRHSRRFRDDAGIGKLKNAILALPETPNENALETLVRPLRDTETDGARLSPLPDWRSGALETRLKTCFTQPRVNIDGEVLPIAEYFRADDLARAFRIFNGFRVLCARRSGPYGAERVNVAIERALGKTTGEYYRGKPLMITRNEPRLRLYNGDIGMVWNSPDDALLRAWFPDPDAENAFMPVNLSRLPEHEPVYAMTIHKSQGSGFQQVLALLSDRDSPLMTRELVYTGVTRAEQSVEIWSPVDVFKRAVSRPTRRAAGLGQAIRNATPRSPVTPQLSS